MGRAGWVRVSTRAACSSMVWVGVLYRQARPPWPPRWGQCSSSTSSTSSMVWVLPRCILRLEAGSGPGVRPFQSYVLYHKVPAQQGHLVGRRMEPCHSRRVCTSIMGCMSDRTLPNKHRVRHTITSPEILDPDPLWIGSKRSPAPLAATPPDSHTSPLAHPASTTQPASLVPCRSPIVAVTGSRARWGFQLA